MSSPALMDYHLHTAVTVDGKMTESQVCERAIAMGMQEIAFTNHIMLAEPDYIMSPANFLKHWEQIKTCQERYPELTIRLGLEMDYYDGRQQEIASTIQQYEALINRPFDLVLGAVHHLNDVFFSSKLHAPSLFDGQETVKIYHDYFATATRAVQSRLYDVMAHPDLIKKYTGEISPRVPFEQYQLAAERYVVTLLDSNVGLEVNTKGYSQTVGEAYPSDDLLAMYISTARARGKEPVITLGSDAHVVAEVGGHIMDGALTLQKMGQGSIMSFKDHSPIPFKF